MPTLINIWSDLQLPQKYANLRGENFCGLTARNPEVIIAMIRSGQWELSADAKKHFDEFTKKDKTAYRPARSIGSKHFSR